MNEKLSLEIREAIDRGFNNSYRPVDLGGTHKDIHMLNCIQKEVENLLESKLTFKAIKLHDMESGLPLVVDESKSISWDEVLQDRIKRLEKSLIFAPSRLHEEDVPGEVKITGWKGNYLIIDDPMAVCDLGIKEEQEQHEPVRDSDIAYKVKVVNDYVPIAFSEKPEQEEVKQQTWRDRKSLLNQ